MKWAALMLVLLGGCLDPVVGADCADGTELCDGRCVTAGTCTVPDAGPGGDGGGGDGDGGGGEDPDAGSPACDVGETLCNEVCVDLDEDPDNCGECGDECEPGQLCSEGMCEMQCEPPTTRCGMFCVNLDTDPDHCGACPIECDSGLCQDGECADATPGHIVVIGHDYEQSNPAMRRVVGNSVFLGLGSTVSVLVWEGDSTAALRNRTDAAIDEVSSAIGRNWVRTVATDPILVPAQLEDHQVFLIYSQRNGDDASFASWGDDWRVALDTFTSLGGTVVLLDGEAGDHGGTFQILRPSGLFDATGRSIVTGQTMRVVNPIDSVAANVPLMYAGEQATVSFETTETGHVVRDESDAPVVIHRVNF
jgi:hypothetical protein